MSKVRITGRLVASVATALAMTALAMTALAGCGSSSTNNASTTSGKGEDATKAPRGDSLTIATSAQFPLDPAQASPPFVLEAAYDSLIHENTDGTYAPDLATSWGFADADHKVYQLKLRTDAKFSDGTPLTADIAVASLKRILATPGPNGSAGPVDTVEAEGTDTVKITYQKAMPESFLLDTYSQTVNFGIIIGPTGTKDPDSLSKASDGIGPYKLDPAQSTSTSTVFVPNDQYFNQDAIKYDKIVVTAMSDPTAALNAVKTGQVDYAFNVGANAASEAQSANLQVSEHGGIIESLILEKRDSGPLADEKVRQAIAQAIDRDAINKAVWYGVGTPQSGIAIKGAPGYDESTADPYPYDAAKAKQALADAGYPDGFTITALDFSAVDPGGALAQALASQLKEVGIILKINVISTGYTQFLAGAASGKYDTVVSVIPGGGVYTTFNQFLAPGTIGNALKIDDPAVEQVADAAGQGKDAAAESAAMVALAQKLNEVEWVVPLAVVPNVDAVSQKVGNVQQGGSNSSPFPFDPAAKGAFYAKQ